MGRSREGACLFQVDKMLCWILFPIYLSAITLYAPRNIQLQWVNKFTYLGVLVSRNATDCIAVNLMPVIHDVKLKLKTWHNLPLSLLGHINLLRIKVFENTT